MVDRLLLFDNGRAVADGRETRLLASLQGKPATVPSRNSPAPAEFAQAATVIQKAPCRSLTFAFANYIRRAASMRHARHLAHSLLLNLPRALLAPFSLLGDFAILDEVNARNGRVGHREQDPGGQSLAGRHRRRYPWCRKGRSVQQGQSLMRDQRTPSLRQSSVR